MSKSSLGISLKRQEAANARNLARYAKRLQEIGKPNPPSLASRVATLTAEVERQAREIAALREVLKRIAESQPASSIPWTHEAAADSYWAALHRCQIAARTALEPKP